MRVLVTGGAGFIGSHLADFYLSQGHEITVLDNLSTGNLANIKPILESINFVNGDIREAKTVEELVSNTDLVLHMAAYLGVKNIMENTLESIDSNFMGSEVVLKAATKYKKRILMAATIMFSIVTKYSPQTSANARMTNTANVETAWEKSK
jgi:UDP-glucose 4-epimerase